MLRRLINLMRLDFPLVRNDSLLGSRYDRDYIKRYSIQEIEQMYIHKSKLTSFAFQIIIQKDYPFKPCFGMLMDTVFFPSRKH